MDFAKSGFLNRNHPIAASSYSSPALWTISPGASNDPEEKIDDRRIALNKITLNNDIMIDQLEKQIQMINLLLLSALNGKGVPAELIADIWPRYIANCRQWSRLFPRQGEDRYKSPDALETMAACYAQLIQSAGKK